MAPAPTATLSRYTRLIFVVLVVFCSLVSPGVSAAAPAPVSGFALPVAPPPNVLNPFHAPDTPYGRGHRGVDLAAATGSSVRAAGRGRVVFAGTVAGRGVVSIEHEGGLRTTYEPVTATVRAGREVTVSEVIGTLQVGHPGCSPVACLHWGARLPGRLYVDPMSLLGSWPVRLLPWDGR
jgi:murein DD-endopeptidase MepM/ murein hydrolase activator NlpD